jgi:hypothetical protein
MNIFLDVFVWYATRYRDERAALERAVRLAKDRNDRHAARAAAAAAAAGHGGEDASNLGSGSAAMMVEGANNGGNGTGDKAKYEISSDEGSSSSDEEAGNADDMNALSAVQGSGMSEEDELALLEAKERIRRQKEERMREVISFTFIFLLPSPTKYSPLLLPLRFPSSLPFASSVTFPRSAKLTASSNWSANHGSLPKKIASPRPALSGDESCTATCTVLSCGSGTASSFAAGAAGSGYGQGKPSK